MSRIYLDNSATTALCDAAKNAMMRAMECYGNPSSLHEAGLEAEARAMLPYRHLNALQTVGFSELFDYFDGTITKEEAVELIKRNSRRYAKRQMTWFRGMERKGITIHWTTV